MKNFKAIVKSNHRVAEGIHLMSFYSPFLAKKSQPGQFLHIRLNKNGVLLRRPFSIHKIKNKDCFIIFKIRGKATRLLSQYKKGDTLEILGPLGNGFYYGRDIFDNRDSFAGCSNVILVAGGIGVAPLVFLAENLKKTYRNKVKCWVFLGAKTKNEIVCDKEFKQLGYTTFVATEDGSGGFKGTVIKLLNSKLKTSGYNSRAYVYLCGPREMIFSIKKTIRKFPYLKCQVSLEQFMGCGIGVCWGCVINTKEGYKRVCKDGPVFNLSDLP